MAAFAVGIMRAARMARPGVRSVRSHMSSSSAAPPAVKTLAVLSYTYTDGMLEKRAPHRQGHLDHAKKAVDDGHMLLGGAFGDVSGGVLLFSNIEAATGFAKSDPYVTSGLVTNWEAKDWSVVVGSLLPHVP